MTDDLTHDGPVEADDPADDERGDGGPVVEAGGTGSPEGSGAVTAETWRLVRACLPEAMQVLDEAGAARVAPLLEALVAGGWRPRQVRDTLAANELPPRVHSMAGLVCSRLRGLPLEHPPVADPATGRPTPTPPTLTAAERRARDAFAAAQSWRHDEQAAMRHRELLAAAKASLRTASSSGRRA